MKSRSKLVAAGIGAAMILGSMFAFPGSASAAPGDYAATSGSMSIGGIGPIAMTASGSGTTSGSSWAGSFTGNGTYAGCIDFTVTPGSHTLNWSGTPTQVLGATTTIVIDSTGCGFPPFDICNLNLTTSKTLTAATFTGSPRTGTFSTAAGTKVGANTITGCTGGAGTLYETIDNAVGGRPGNVNLTVQLANELQ